MDSLTAPLTQAQEYGAGASATLTFCTSYFVGSPLLAEAHVTAEELRCMINDKVLRHILVPEVPEFTSRREVVLAISAADPAWQLTSTTVAIDAIFHDNLTACLLIQPDGTIAADHVAANEAVGHDCRVSEEIYHPPTAFFPPSRQPLNLNGSVQVKRSINGLLFVL